MKVLINQDKEVVNVTLQGKMTFQDHQNFKEVLNKAGDTSVKNINMDMSGLEFIDSAGLGMLLLLKDQSAKNNIAVCLRSPKGAVQKMLAISKFEDLFSITD